MDKIMNNSDESFLRWRISVEEENNMIEEEEPNGEPLLKTVVRTNYLYHLRQSLRKNLEAMKQTTDGVEESSINKVIKGCSALLEEKALRNCMIARLYQRMMSQIIKEIKKATNEGSIYSPLKEFADRQSMIATSPTIFNKEIQTDLGMSFFPTVVSDLQKQTETLLGHRNTILTNYSDHEPDDLKIVNGSQKTWCVKCSKETLGRCSHAANEAQNYQNSADFNGISGKHTTNRKRPEQNIKTEPDDKDIDASQFSGADKNDDFQAKLKSVNFVEAVSYWHYVECDIADLPPKKRKKLDAKFIKLFGNDHSIDYYFLTDEQKSLTCRKRIAKYVVIELTTYYSKKKIASKQLFKTLAKHITSLLLGRSLYPAPEEVKRSVEEFFHDGRVIKTEDDFYI